MTETKPYEGHTPLPWSVFDGDDVVRPGIDGKTGTVVVYGSADDDTQIGIDAPSGDLLEAHANAALIVHRVNKGPAADAMANELSVALGWLQQVRESGDHYIPPIVIDDGLKALAAYREKSE